MEDNKNIGVISDLAGLHSLSGNIHGYSSFKLCYEPDLQEVVGCDILFIYAHNIKGKRHKCLGLRTVKGIREKGCNLPLIVFTWFDTLTLQINYSEDNPYITPYCKCSCKFIRLPLKQKEILKAIKEVKSFSQTEDEECKKHLNEIQGKHH